MNYAQTVSGSSITESQNIKKKSYETMLCTQKTLIEISECKYE